ncbi:MAG: peptidoglycan DD-metalloendopeptidase family protein [Bacteroidota bacterium]
MRFKATTVKTIIILLSFLLCDQMYSQNNQAEMTFNIPVEGQIASLYGWRSIKNEQGVKEKKFHKGIDIAGKYGSPIYASQEGEVVFMGMNGGYGKFVEIRHNDNYSTAYGHLRKYFVKKGDYVYAGQKIGEMGNSGTTFSTIGGKGVHLHFEIRDNTKITWYSPKGAVNPKIYLQSDISIDKYTKISFSQQNDYMVSYGIAKIKTLFTLPEPFIRYNMTALQINSEELIYLNSKKYIHNSDPIKIDIPEISLPEKPGISLSQKTAELKINYAIQVEAYNYKLTDSQIENLEKKYKTGGMRFGKTEINGVTWYKYTIGIFDDMEEAKNYQKILFPDSKNNKSAICAFENNMIIKTFW